MNLKRAVWMSVVVYAISFAIGIITAAILGVDLTEATEPPVSVWIISIVVTVAILAAFTWWYFKDKKVKPNAKEGLFFGLTMIIVGTILDMTIIIPYILTNDAGTEVLTYYANPLFLLTIVLLLATTTIVGWSLEQKGKSKK